MAYTNDRKLLLKKKDGISLSSERVSNGTHNFLGKKGLFNLGITLPNILSNIKTQVK